MAECASSFCRRGPSRSAVPSVAPGPMPRRVTSIRATPSEAADVGASSLASLDEAGQDHVLQNAVQKAWWPNPHTIIEDILRATDDRRGRTGPRSYAEIEKALAGKRKARAARNA